MRPRRPDYAPNHYYHIYNRGAHGVSVFREDENYHFVLRQVKQYAAEFELSVIAYCLMPNHYHFLVRQDGGFRAGLLPQRVFNSYSKADNKRSSTAAPCSRDLFKSSILIPGLSTAPVPLYPCQPG